MAQEFEVVRCFSCQTFQIHQTRKDHKFSCKICGEKQSRKKVYCEGSAKDCRAAVQQLNSNIQIEEETFIKDLMNASKNDFDGIRQELDDDEGSICKPANSKWNVFLEDDDESLPGTSCDSNNCKYDDRIEMESDKTDSKIVEKESSTFAVSAFTSVKRYHDSAPKQFLQKKQDNCNLDFQFYDEISLRTISNRSNNRHKSTSADERDHLLLMKSEFEACPSTSKSMSPKASTPLTESHPNKPKPLRAKRKVASEGLAPSENVLKEEAFKKFSSLDDNILDTLNKSFYSI